MLQSHRRAHARIAAGLFAGLGLQVGAWGRPDPASRRLARPHAAELGAGLAVMAATSIGALPPHEAAAHDAPAGAPHETAVAAGEAAGHESRDGSSGRLVLLHTPAIAVAVGLVTLCFFGDGAIEGYAALFLRDVLESGSLLTGAALAAFHTASLSGGSSSRGRGTSGSC